MNLHPITMLLLNDIAVQFKQCFDALIGLHALVYQQMISALRIHPNFFRMPIAKPLVRQG
jgi:hypothetical protein